MWWSSSGRELRASGAPKAIVPRPVLGFVGVPVRRAQVPYAIADPSATAVDLSFAFGCVRAGRPFPNVAGKVVNATRGVARGKLPYLAGSYPIGCTRPTDDRSRIPVSPRIFPPHLLSARCP